MVDSALRRLSISQLRKKSSRKPQFELVHDISPAEPPAYYPFDMDVHIVNSKLYSLGGGRHIDDSFVPNLDVYCLDLTSSEGPSISEDPGICEGLRICEGPIIPKWFICEFSCVLEFQGLLLGGRKNKAHNLVCISWMRRGSLTPSRIRFCMSLGQYSVLSYPRLTVT